VRLCPCFIALFGRVLTVTFWRNLLSMIRTLNFSYTYRSTIVCLYYKRLSDQLYVVTLLISPNLVNPPPLHETCHNLLNHWHTVSSYFCPTYRFFCRQPQGNVKDDIMPFRRAVGSTLWTLSDRWRPCRRRSLTEVQTVSSSTRWGS